MTAPLEPVTAPEAPPESDGAMTVEELAAAIQAILDQAIAEGREMTDDEVAKAEALEHHLAAAQKRERQRQKDEARRAALAARQVTRLAPVNAGLIGMVAPTKPDNTLERAFQAYLRTGQGNQDISHLRAQEVGATAAGGYTVPPGFRQKLVEVMKAFGGLAAEVDSYDTDTGAPVEFPSLNDTANQGDIAAESGTADGADLTFGSVPLGSYRYTSAGAGSGLPLRVSVELLQDSAFDIERLVTRVMGTRIARKQAAHWCTGTGVGQPLGIVGNVTADNTLDVSNTIDYDDLLDTEEALDPAYEQNAKWLLNKAAWTQIRGIVDSAGRPIILPQAESGIGGRPEKTLLGYPVVIDQGMPSPTTATARFAVLGDLREAYVIRRVSNLVIVVNPYTRANNGQVEYTGWERADGTVQNRSAYSVVRNV